VGTASFDVQVTGAAGAGAVTLSLLMSPDEFGFHVLFVPTLLGVEDTLGTKEDVRIGWKATHRLTSLFREAIPTTTVLAVNFGTLRGASPALQPETVDQTVLDAVWATNTDTETYHFHGYGVVYDLERLRHLEDLKGPLTGAL